MEPETLTKKRRRSDDDSPAAEPRWVMLSPNITTRESSNSFPAADAKTTAASCTSSGQSFTLSCGLAPPPSSSSFYCQWSGGAPGDGKYRPDPEDIGLCVIAAHDDVVLIQISLPKRKGNPGLCPLDYHYEYFLYETGAGRPPLLSLLPSCYISMQFERKKDVLQDPIPRQRSRSLDSMTTGVLRRGEGKILVVQLELGYDYPYNNAAELCVLLCPSRRGREWVIKRVPIVHHHKEEDEEQQWWGRRPEVEAAVPVGNRYMCWVNYHNGFYLCDMAKNKKAPKLRYVELPVLAYDATTGDSRDFYWPRGSLNLAAAGPDAVRFVALAPRCCCGGPGKTSCERSSSAFNVTTWTMNVRTAEATWVKERVVDCDELWHLLPSNDYEGFGHDTFEYPILSADDPDIICFSVDARMVEVNTRSKVLLSIVPSPGVRDNLPAKLHW